MKTITINEYEANATQTHVAVLLNGDVVCVYCKDNGKLVIMEEPQYKVMHDALKTVMAAANMDDDTYKAVLRAGKHAGVKGSYGRDV